MAAENGGNGRVQFETVEPIVQKQHKTFKSSPFKEREAVRNKYSSDKYQRVALVKPRVLVLEEDEE
mgnify:CR=1 FL=1